MRRIRVLFGANDPSLSESIAKTHDMTIVGEVQEPVELLLAVSEFSADVVILPLDSEKTPGVSSHLFSQYPELTVLGVTRHEGRAYVEQLCPRQSLIEDVRDATLIKAIRWAVRHPCSRST